MFIVGQQCSSVSFSITLLTSETLDRSAAVAHILIRIQNRLKKVLFSVVHVQLRHKISQRKEEEAG